VAEVGVGAGDDEPGFLGGVDAHAPGLAHFLPAGEGACEGRDGDGGGQPGEEGADEERPGGAREPIGSDEGGEIGERDPDDDDGDPEEAEEAAEGFGGFEVCVAAGLVADLVDESEDAAPVGGEDQREDESGEVGHGSWRDERGLRGPAASVVDRRARPHAGRLNDVDAGGALIFGE